MNDSVQIANVNISNSRGLVERLERIRTAADQCRAKYAGNGSETKDWGSVAWDMWDMWGSAPPSSFQDSDTSGRVRTQLAIIQPSPLCNIDCSYCYLPGRDDTAVMSQEILKLSIRRLFESPFTYDAINLVWHAGEPLVVPKTFYEKAFGYIKSFNQNGVRVQNSIQTNGTLINESWCEFFSENSIDIGVSLDGPQFIHDARRVDRQGKGTFDRTMRGVRLLQDRGIEFSIIMVLTDIALNHPDEIWNFFIAQGISRICFNVEEIEGANSTSSLNAKTIQNRFERFFERIIELNEREKGVSVRELDFFFGNIRNGSRAHPVLSTENMPFRIVAIDHLGNISTFSPELLTMRHFDYGDFLFGNVLHDSISDIASSSKFLRVNKEIGYGIQKCKESCKHFLLCGGGTPVNKLYENGCFDSTETMYCRLKVKSLSEIVMKDFEQRYAL